MRRNPEVLPSGTLVNTARLRGWASPLGGGGEWEPTGSHGACPGSHPAQDSLALGGGAAPGSPRGRFFPAESPKKPKCHSRLRLRQIGSQTGPLGSSSAAAAWASPPHRPKDQKTPARPPPLLSSLSCTLFERLRSPPHPDPKAKGCIEPG